MPSSSSKDPDPPTIAVLGTGRMGTPIARNLLAAGFPVSVWDRTPASLEALAGDEWTQRLAELATEHGLEYVDSPVSGSDGPARDGELVVLASDPEKARHRVQPIFDAIGRTTLWLGPAGNGSRFKLVLNNWLATQRSRQSLRRSP
jgi:3-hydroxyisobutyrate dehydrogenase